MANDTMTLALTGNVPFEAFVNAVSHWMELVNALAIEVRAAGKVTWYIQDLSSGSALATIRGEAQVIEDVENIVRAYEETADALQKGTPIPYSIAVADHARGITRILNGHVETIRFETPRCETVIASPASPPYIKATPTLVATGAIQGRIQTLTERHALRFTLYDALNDKAVSCYLAEAQRELVRNLWGKQVAVQGTITRDAETGRPLVVRQITSIQVMEDRRGSYLSARGALLRRPDMPMPEDVIRKIRDA
ncbi:MAG: hypothetical protein HW388_733 [Dehalococcoidia bacterium]|nr:hypothetical protein [Dehalococcoidia bacterium]